MWKCDGKEVNLPVTSVKKGDVDLELKINQQIILNKNDIVKEIVSDIIKLINIFSCLKLLKICKRLIPPLWKPSILFKKVIKNYLFSLKFIIM